MFHTVNTKVRNAMTNMKAEWRQIRTEQRFEMVLKDLRGERLLVEVTRIGGASAKGTVVKIKHDVLYLRAQELSANEGFDVALWEVPLALIGDVKVFAPVAPVKEQVAEASEPVTVTEPVEGVVIVTEEATPAPEEKDDEKAKAPHPRSGRNRAA